MQQSQTLLITPERDNLITIAQTEMVVLNLALNSYGRQNADAAWIAYSRMTKSQPPMGAYRALGNFSPNRGLVCFRRTAVRPMSLCGRWATKAI
ncbi:MAG: hypothetical protein GPOALKHO_001333 [Sodalis sp.]|nr:MAG: hypothetical protein GPOALKHO_001333 [Sodalis sp.]